MDIASVEEIKQARPIIRSVLAFLVFMRTGRTPEDGAYRVADEFLDELESDLDRAVERPVKR